VRNTVCGLSYLIIFAAATSLLISPQSSHTLVRLIMCGVAFTAITIVELASARNHLRLAAHILVSCYLFFAVLAVLGWGATLPVVMLTFGVAIVLAGLLLGANSALYTAGLAALIVTILQLAINWHWYVPSDPSVRMRSSVTDILASCIVFGLLALLVWFYQRELTFSSDNTKRAEISMSQHKVILAAQIRKRKSKLEQMQLEEIERMYRFAELGQLGVTLLHDLANYLTALTLEIDGIQSKKYAKALVRARDIIHYLESSVDSTRDRLQGDNQNESFNIIAKTSEAVTFLRYKAQRQGVIIAWEPPAQSWAYTGDPCSYCQIATIVTGNAIDAYDTLNPKTSTPQERLVIVSMERNAADIILHVNDWGRGISKRQRKNLFKPFHSTKKAGLGIGLFMARQTVEASFGGTLVHNVHSDHTEFIITLPLVQLPSGQPTTSGN